jgi:hypothetical protein
MASSRARIACEDRSGAVGRDADDERRAVDDRAEGEIAMGRPVDQVDRHADRARGAGESFRLLLVVEATHGDRGAGQIGGPPGAMAQRNRPARGLGRQGTQLLARTLGEDVDIGAGRREELRLPRRRRPVAGDDGAPAFEREEDRQPRQRRHTQSARLAETHRRRHQYTSC